jgi:hypothetical protein
LLIAVLPEELSRLDRLFTDAGQFYAIVGDVEIREVLEPV